MDFNELEPISAGSAKSENDLFPRRLDHVYVIRAAGSVGSKVIYVGKTTRPGRALEHWAGAANSNLADAMKLGFSQTAWPEIFTIPLSVPSWEDLAIFETTLIDFFKNDHRFECINGTDGDEIFRPRQVETAHPIKTTSVDHYWESKDGGYELVNVASDASARWTTAPLSHPENASRLRNLLQQLALNGTDALDSWQAEWPPFFGFLQGFGITSEGHSLPWGGVVSISDIREILGESFVLVSVKGNRFDDADGVRPGFGIGIDEPTLRERASRYWEKGSSSHPYLPGRTLSKAETSIAPPRFLVAVSGAKGEYAVVGAWPLEDLAWTVEGTKIEFPIAQPNCSIDDVAKVKEDICRKLVGRRLIDKLDWKSKGALWCV